MPSPGNVSLFHSRLRGEAGLKGAVGIIPLQSICFQTHGKVRQNQSIKNSTLQGAETRALILFLSSGTSEPLNPSRASPPPGSPDPHPPGQPLSCGKERALIAGEKDGWLALSHPKRAGANQEQVTAAGSAAGHYTSGAPVALRHWSVGMAGRQNRVSTAVRDPPSSPPCQKRGRSGLCFS